MYLFLLNLKCSVPNLCDMLHASCGKEQQKHLSIQPYGPVKLQHSTGGEIYVVRPGGGMAEKSAWEMQSGDLINEGKESRIGE